MKKLISILLAVSLMAMSTMASAGTALKAGGQRNPGSASNNSGNSDFLRDYKNVPFQLAVYRPGDTLTFSNDTEKMSKGDVITFISSYVDAADYNSSTVMFIDQVTAESDSPSYSYKIRDGLQEGIYKLEIKIGDADVKEFYYAIGDPKVEIAYIDEDETIQYLYDEKDEKTYYFASAQLGSGDVTYNQLGVAEYGFDFGNNNVFTFDASVFDTAVAEQELTGSINWFFTIGLMDAQGVEPTAAPALINE